LRDQLAVPLGFEDFGRARQRMLGYPDRSRFLAYHMFLSARDMARVGLLALRGGEWIGRQLVPAAWLRESMRSHVAAAQMSGRYRNGPCGYGYYWWIPERSDPDWRGAFMAVGNFGQFMLCLPALGTIIVHRREISDEKAMARNAGLDLTDLPSVTMATFLALAELTLAAREVSA
jgi:CubicO group peptidase (beta-lactamase class C family)